MKFLALVLMTGLLLAGCAVTDNISPPTPLEPIEQTLQVHKLWSRDTGDGEGKFFQRLRPYVEDGNSYVVDYRGKFSAWDKDGKPLWQTALKTEITAGVNGGDGVVVAGSEDRKVYALAAESGEQVWSQQLSSTVTALSRVSSGILVARSGDGYIYGLDAHSGEIKWKVNRTVPALSINGQSEPLVAQDAVLVGLDNGRLLLISLQTGQAAWEKIVAVPKGRSEIERMVDIDGPMALKGVVVFLVTYHGKVAAVDARSGKTIWMHDASSVTGVIAVGDRIVFSDENGVVWSLDERTGVPVWKQEALKFRRLTTPAAIGDDLVVGDFEGYLHWLDAETGKIVARTRADSAGVLAAPVSADGRVYVLGQSGKLSVWEIDDSK